MQILWKLVHRTSTLYIAIWQGSRAWIKVAKVLQLGMHLFPMNCILYLHTARTIHLHSHLSLSNIEAVMKDVNDLLDVALDYNLSYDEFLSEKVIELGFFYVP